MAISRQKIVDLAQIILSFIFFRFLRLVFVLDLADTINANSRLSRAGRLKCSGCSFGFLDRNFIRGIG